MPQMDVQDVSMEVGVDWDAGIDGNHGQIYKYETYERCTPQNICSLNLGTIQLNHGKVFFFWILLITFCSVTWDFRVLLFAHCGDLSLLCLVTSFHLVPCAVSGGVTVGHEAFRGDATYFHSIQVGSDPCIIIKTFCSRPRASQW